MSIFIGIIGWVVIIWFLVRRSQVKKERTRMAPAVHCPTCGSGNVQRIGNGKKAAAGLSFGVLAAGYVTKTFKCGACRASW